MQHVIVIGWLCTAAWGSMACAPKRVPTMSVTDLMEDRVTLDGVLLKCNQDTAKAHNDPQCMNARIAVERLANEVDPVERTRHDAEFERSRERLRLAEEKARQQQAEKNKVDAYDLPVVPVDTAPASGEVH